MRSIWVFALLLSACSSGGESKRFSDAGWDLSEDPGTEDSGGQDVSADIGSGPCDVVSASDLEGVEIAILGERCSWTKAELAAGVLIPYQVRVDSALTVIPAAQDAGGCERPGPSGLTISFRIQNLQNEVYCLCDVGLCMASQDPSVLVAGTYHQEIEWSGTTWNGPSDTGNPLGPAFSAGPATLTVSALGKKSDGSSFSVSSTMTIHVVD